MFRNPHPNAYNTSYQSYQGRNSLSKTGSNFNNQSRSPLYPIGPSLTHQQFHPVVRGPSLSPYVTSKQGLKPPSYEQKYMRSQISGINQGLNQGLSQFKYEDKQRRLIDRNQVQILQQQKRRQTLRASYQRQIQALQKTLNRNSQRKHNLLTQIQSLQQTNTQLHTKLSSLTPPIKPTNLNQSLEHKQQDIIFTKNRLLQNIKQKQQQFNKELQEQELYWENQIKQKEKILIKGQESFRIRKADLIKAKANGEKIDFYAVQDQIRQHKYQDFLYQAQLIQDNINRLINQRQNQQRQVDQALKTKRHNVHTILIKHDQFARQCCTSRIRADQLQRVSKQMSSANQNLMKQLQRKQKMIQKYQLDIHCLKQRKDHQQQNLSKMMNQARDSIPQQMQSNINDKISKCQQQIRHQMSITNRLKSQYQKLYEILCSTASRNVHQTFNSMLKA